MSVPITVPFLSTTELDSLTTHFNAIHALLAEKFINLQPEDRVRYGSIKEQNKLVVFKVKDYHASQPELSSPKVDWGDYEGHLTTRTCYKAITDKLAQLQELCDDPRTLVDYTLYNMAMQDYRYTKFNAEEPGGGEAGFEAKYNDLRQFFEHEEPVGGAVGN